MGNSGQAALIYRYLKKHCFQCFFVFADFADVPGKQKNRGMDYIVDFSLTANVIKFSYLFERRS